MENFKIAFEVLDYGKSVWRTITLDIVSAAIEVIVCAIVAYGFARFEFPGKKIFEFLLMVTIVVPVQVYIVSMCVNFKNLDVAGVLGLINNLTGIDLRVNILNTNLTMYLPSLFGMGLRSGILIYIYIQFFKGFPKELEEAAYIDGAGPFRTFWKIAVPSSGVAILTVSVFSVIWHWNDYTLGLMYFTKNYPLAVQLSNLPDVLAVSNPYAGGAMEIMKDPIIMAGCLLYIAPLLIGYLCIQNKFVKSIDRVGITG
jgi:multiple sugar transport system permease protein